jgi:F-box and leucine-rich repeat protein 2/20
LPCIRARFAWPLRREALPRVLRLFLRLAGLDDACLAVALSAEADPLAGVRRVCLAQATGVGWRRLEAMVAACPCLEPIDLTHCVATGDREMATVAAAAELKGLALDKCLAVAPPRRWSGSHGAPRRASPPA